jgi:hypothetical protein
VNKALMGNWMLKTVKLLGIVLIVIIIIIVGWFYVVPYRVLISGPFSWKEMDLNKDGFVSPMEADYFADYGIREYTENGIVCKEYFALKDGLPLKKVCTSKQ